MFRNQGPDYYGDNDEMDGNLAAEEDEAQREGESPCICGTIGNLADIQIGLRLLVLLPRYSPWATRRHLPRTLV